MNKVAQPIKLKKRCPTCKKIFYVIPSKFLQVNCSNPCKFIYQHGKNNPNWRGLKTKICLTCKKSFPLIKPHHRLKTTKYCSKKCQTIGVTSAQRKRVKKQCPVCSKLFEGSLIHMQVRKTCSYKCMGKNVKRNGKKNPNWRGGKSFEPYPPTFNQQLKDKIRVRDKFICQLCGVPELECNRRLSIHHIDYIKENCKENNLISLCISCNGKVNTKRKYWEGYFSERNILKAKVI